MNYKNFEKNRPLIQVVAWVVILILVLLFWPREKEEIVLALPVEKEVIFVELKTPVEPEPQIELPIELPVEPEPLIPPRYGFTPDDIYLMTVLLCGSGATDGDGEYDIDFNNQDNYEQISLVLNIVMNRVISDKFPNTVAKVIWQPNQFSPMSRWTTKKLPIIKPESYAIVQEWCRAYDTHDLSIMSIPETHLYFSGNGTINKSRERWKN